MLAFVLVSGSLWIILGELWMSIRHFHSFVRFSVTGLGAKKADAPATQWAEAHRVSFITGFFNFRRLRWGISSFTDAASQEA